MTISVIIPAYNCERYLKRCLDSLLSQVGAQLDVIVINDGSTDGTATILEEYSQKIRFKTTVNQGSSAAKNEAIAMIKGDYVMFLDADDWLDAQAIERLCTITEETDADVVRFRCRKVFPDGRQIIDKNQFDHYEVIEKEDFKTKLYPYFIRGIRLNSVCLGIYKAKLIQGKKFREDMPVAEDAVFSLGIYTAANKAVLIPDILYNYYQSGMGLTGNGVKILQKYRCNFVFAAETACRLKKWDMNNIPTRIKVYLRPFFLTFDKIKRVIFSQKLK